MPTKFTTLLDEYLDAKAALDAKKIANPEGHYYGQYQASDFYKDEQSAYDAAEKAINDLVGRLLAVEASVRTNMGRMSHVDEARSKFPLQNLPIGMMYVHIKEPPTAWQDKFHDSLVQAFNAVTSGGERISKVHIPVSLRHLRMWSTASLWGAEVVWEERESVEAVGTNGTTAHFTMPTIP